MSHVVPLAGRGFMLWSWSSNFLSMRSRVVGFGGRRSSGKRSTNLSITHISSGKFVAQRDVHQANHATPQNGIARRRIVGTRKVATQASEGREVVADGPSSARGRLGVYLGQDAKLFFGAYRRGG